MLTLREMLKRWMIQCVCARGINAAGEHEPFIDEQTSRQKSGTEETCGDWSVIAAYDLNGKHPSTSRYEASTHRRDAGTHTYGLATRQHSVIAPWRRRSKQTWCSMQHVPGIIIAGGSKRGGAGWTDVGQKAKRSWLVHVRRVLSC